MFLFVGLGNPGKQYEKTRHNIGFVAVDKIAYDYNFGSESTKFHGIIQEGRIDTHKVLILKPQTFMNRSGLSVMEAAKFFKIHHENIIVFHDEIDLPFAKLRVKTGGGHGGHNGLRDIDAKIGKNYRRVRIGVGHPGDKDMVSSYVLGKFSNDEEPTVDKIVESISANCPLLVKNDDNLFMTKLSK